MLLKKWNDIGLQRKNSKWIFALIAAACAAIFAGVLANKAMVPTEGWYSYYAYIMNEEGAVPYVDFELLFPPLYTYLIAFFTRIFGYEIMALRVLGVIIFSLTALFAYLIFEKLTDKPIFALIASLLTVSILQSESVQIFYDYIRFMDLAVYISIYFLICAVCMIEKQGKIRIFEPVLIVGVVFAVIASMLKQSSGLIFLLYIAVFFVFAAIVFPHSKMYLKALGISACITAVMYGAMAAYLASQGSLSKYIYYNFQAAVAAKGGSIWTVLFGWISRTGFSVWILPIAILAAALLFGLVYMLYRFSKRYEADGEYKKASSSLLLTVFCISFAILFVISLLFFDELKVLLVGSQKKFVAFLMAGLAFATTSIAAIVFKVRKKTIPEGSVIFCFFSGCVFMLAYAVCTSYGLAESQIALGYPLFAMILLPFLKFKKSEWVAMGLAVAMLFNTAIGFERKLINIYSWWGLEVGSISEQTEECSVPLLNGIKMNKTYAEMYDGVTASVQKHTVEGEEIFVFPHMPVFYVLCDRPRATDTANQWFDVSTDASVIADIDVLAQKKPKVLITCIIDDSVVDAHEEAFRQGGMSGLHEMQNFLVEFIKDESYVNDGSYKISDTYTVEVWYLP